MFQLLLGPAPLAFHSASASPPLVKRAYGVINDSWVADGQIDFAALDTATRLAESAGAGADGSVGILFGLASTQRTSF
ncbi:glucose oxidase [Moniliophthora roreri]|uniref:Uncharacterized protein n=1 Tax=Moniliophthora roreri TaxID=221103 RepID=A0A0W0G694_MONRR|nr:glucose oxidase [Moniliophthora roreri]